MNVKSAAQTRRHYMGHFKAPWDTQVRVITALVVLLAVVVSVWQGPPASLALWAIVLGAAIFAPRGYTVRDATLFVHRLGWSTKIDLSDLESVEWEPGATTGSLRTMGNGGLFGYVGHFRNDLLGSYRAWATDGARVVVLKTADRTLVVTPDEPAVFVHDVRAETGVA